MLGYYKNPNHSEYEIIINNDFEPDYSVVLDYFGESEKLADMEAFDKLSKQEQDELVAYCDSKTTSGEHEYFCFIIEKTDENGKKEIVAEAYSIPTVKDLILTMSRKFFYEVDKDDKLILLQDFFPTHDLGLLIIDYYKGEFRKFDKLLGVDYENKQAKIYNQKGEVENVINIYRYKFVECILNSALDDGLNEVKEKFDDECKEIMFDLFDSYDDYDHIKNALRSLNSARDITDNQYDYCMDKWEDFLDIWEKRGE